MSAANRSRCRPTPLGGRGSSGPSSRCRVRPSTAMARTGTAAGWSTRSGPYRLLVWPASVPRATRPPDSPLNRVMVSAPSNVPRNSLQLTGSASAAVGQGAAGAAPTAAPAPTPTPTVARKIRTRSRSRRIEPPWVHVFPAQSARSRSMFSGLSRVRKEANFWTPETVLRITPRVPLRLEESIKLRVQPLLLKAGRQPGPGYVVHRQEPDRPGAPGGPVQLVRGYLEHDAEPVAPVRAGYPATPLPPGDLVTGHRRVAGHGRKLSGERHLRQSVSDAGAPDQLADRFFRDRVHA